MSRKHSLSVKVLYFIFFASALVVLAGEINTLGAMFLHVMSLLPALLLNKTVKTYSVKIFVGFTCLISTVSLFFFYLNSEQYFFGGHRPFDFHFYSALRVSLILGTFLFLIMIGENLLRSVNFRNGQRKRISTHIQNGHEFSISLSGYSRSPFNSTIIMSLIILSLPIKIWMFNNAVGLVGVAPPRLPFRLSGILYYCFNLIVPLLIAYLYLGSKRKFFLGSIILLYGLLIGILSTSKFVFLVCAAPVVILSLLDKRWIMFAISSVLVAVGLSFILFGRTLVHQVSDGTSFAEVGNGSLSLILGILTDIEFSSDMFFAFVGLVDRIEGFTGLHLSSSFDPISVGGHWGIFKAAIYQPWANLDPEAMHLEFLGYTLPAGFVGVSASVNSWMLMASNTHYYMLVPFAMYTLIILRLIETVSLNIGVKYALSQEKIIWFTWFLMLFFYLAMGHQTVMGALLLFTFIALIPKIVLSKG